jgi:hypothetical protein
MIVGLSREDHHASGNVTKSTARLRVREQQQGQLLQWEEGGKMRKLMASLLALPVIASTVPVFAQESKFDVRARETEQQMTDDERFSLIVSSWAPFP